MIESRQGRVAESSKALVFLLAALMVAMSLLAAKPAHAKTFTVDFSGDFSDINPGDGICDGISSPSLNPCTLRAAIEEANAFAGADTVNFDISFSGVKTISPASALPGINERVTIDGYSQPGSKPNTLASGNNAAPKIQLDGTNAGDAPGLSLSGDGSVIRGLVINRFGRDGVLIAGPGGKGNKIEGNFIGTDATGTQDLGNTDNGVLIDGTSNNTVGGTTAGARNVISGNDGGIVIIDSEGNEFQGNFIGTDKNGTAGLGNSSYGVGIFSSILAASNNKVGGSASARNTIAFNGAEGVAVVGGISVNNRIFSNSIHSNGGLGIDLGGNGITPNDPKDPDFGANNLQNKPLITSAKPTKKKKKKLTSIAGTLNSKANKTFTVQLFSNPSGTKEGKTFLGQKSVKTNAGGNATFEIDVSRNKAPIGSAITATATDSEGNTSEFSAPKKVVKK